MNTELDDEMLLISQLYPPEIYSQFLPQQDATDHQENSSSKPRRRRKKNKGDQNGSSGEGAMMRKRKLSEEQVKMLEQSFGDEHKLESERKDRLAHELGLDPRQVAVWFQNRRARWKSKKLEEEYARLKSEHENTVVEKCRLETELLKLNEQLNDAEREINRLSADGFSSNSPSCSSFSNMEAIEQQFLGGFAMDNGMFNNVQENSYAYGMEWDNLYYL